jgi:uncharacterized delta-60 repeat protein
MNRKLMRRMTLPLIAACLGLADCSSSSSDTSTPPTAFAVLRLTTNGAADTNFAGGRGIAVTKIDPALFDFALAVAVEPAPSNKIIAAGSSGFAGQGAIALVRYNTDGTVDTANFGTAATGGIVRTPAPAGWTSASASAVAVQPADNKIVVAALAFNAATGTTGIAVIRYKTDGTLDTTFNTTGVVTATIGPGVATDTCGLALQGTNIIVAGASSNGNVVLYRYDVNGALDTTFGTVGVTTTPIGAPAMSPALALQSDGRIILASGTSVDQVLLRYSANGALDTTFGGAPGGIVTTDVGGGVNFANAVAVQSTPAAPSTDDKIVVAGHANVNFSTGTSDISLVRYTKDGVPDTTFGPNSNGIVTTDLAGKFDNALSLALQPQLPQEPMIVVAGNTSVQGFTQMAVLRYLPTGAPDGAFASNGVAVVSRVGPSDIASGNAVALQPVSGGIGIVVAGFD